MTKKWINWNENELINESDTDFVHSTKFKLLIFSFLIIFFLLINLRIIEVLSLADGKVIPQGRIKYVQHFFCIHFAKDQTSIRITLKRNLFNFFISHFHFIPKN